MRPNPCGVCLLALAAAMPAAAKVDPAMDRQIAGVFSNACSNRAQPMVRLYGDVMSIEVSGKTVTASKFRTLRTSPVTPPPADFKVAFEGDVSGGDGLVFVLTHDAQGLFVTIVGGAKSLALLGPGVQGQRLRHCDPNRNALPGTPPPVELGPPEMLRDAVFKSAYVKALGPLAKTYWLTRLDGPAQPVKTVKAAGADYQLVSACKPHDCYDHSMLVLYAAGSRSVFGKIHQTGRSTLIGNPSPALAAELERLWLAQYRQKN
ncbi:MAG: Ivy family c-type lysozyme inhibitor [Burkholderiaceae bacterium]|nr:Ivy family c-type lysozyme inhibitor [Burkholderiaceae bacterium]